MKDENVECKIRGKMTNEHKGHSVSNQQIFCKFPARPSQILIKFS